MASSKLSEKDKQAIIRYAKTLSDHLFDETYDKSEWKDSRIDMLRVLSEKYPDFEEIQNIYAHTLFILSGGRYNTKHFYYDNVIKYVRKIALLSAAYPTNEKIAEKYAEALRALCKSDLDEESWESDEEPRIYGWMFETYKEIIGSLKLLTTIFPDNLAVFQSYLSGMSACILESEFDESYEEVDDDGESTAGQLRNELATYVFAELKSIKPKAHPAEVNDVIALFTWQGSNLFDDLIDDLTTTYWHDINDEFTWSRGDNTSFLYYLGRLKIIEDFTEKLYKQYPQHEYIIGFYSRIQYDLYVNTEDPELDVSSFHEEKEKKLLTLYKKHKDNEYATENYAGYLNHISMGENITASMRRINKTKLKRLAKQFPENSNLEYIYANLTEFLDE